MIEIDNWSLSMYPNDKFFVNKEIYNVIKNYSKLDYYLSGELGDNLYISLPVKEIDSNIVTSKNDITYNLKNKSKNYIKYENAVNNAIPILYGWSVTNKREKPFITAVYYQNGRFHNIKDKIIGYDNNRGTLKLEIFGEAFLVLGAYSEKEKEIIKSDANLYRVLYEDNQIFLEDYIDYLFKNPVKEEFTYKKKKHVVKPS